MRIRDPGKALKIRQRAMELILEQGLDGFSMQKLARAARVSPGTLYIHFEDRDDLLFQLCKEQFEALSATVLEGFDPAMPFADGLRVQWRNRIRFSREHPAGWGLLEQVMHSPYHQLFASRMGTSFRTAMGDFVRRAVAAGELTSFGLAPDELDAFPVELYWSLAYAPLYQLLRQEQGRGDLAPRHGRRRFRLDDETFEKALASVLRGLRP